MGKKLEDEDERNSKFTKWAMDLYLTSCESAILGKQDSYFRAQHLPNLLMTGPG